MPEVKWCYQQALQRNDKLAGKLKITFTVGSTGEVLEVKVLKDEVGDADLAECVLAKVKRWKFPAPEGGGIVSVNYPFVFATTE
jgi:TonB family protein